MFDQVLSFHASFLALMDRPFWLYSDMRKMFLPSGEMTAMTDNISVHGQRSAELMTFPLAAKNTDHSIAFDS